MGVGCATRARGAVGSAQFYDLDSIRVQNETKTAQNINGNASAETPQNTPNHSTRAIKTGQRGAGRAGGGPCRVWEGFTKIRVFRPPCRPASPPERGRPLSLGPGVYIPAQQAGQDGQRHGVPPGGGAHSQQGWGGEARSAYARLLRAPYRIGSKEACRALWRRETGSRGSFVSPWLPRGDRVLGPK